MTASALHLFEGYGIEIELAVVDRKTLDVLPVVDRILRAGAGSDEWVDDVDDGPISWSNELVGHCVELKTNGPAPAFEGLAAAFDVSRAHMAALAEPLGACLLPTAMHPWMDPARETQLWKHGNLAIYAAYDRLFDCRRHGWANVQSVHLNLPFDGEDEFGRLMAAARLVLPLVPALAASSPVADGVATGLLDARLEHYRTNSLRVPSMTAGVVPEPIYDFETYREQVFGRLDQQLVAIGAEPELLGQEWTNARGVIARFDRMALEIRLIDAQESMHANVAVAAAVSAVVRGLVEERWSPRAMQAALASDSLRDLLTEAQIAGPGLLVEDAQFLSCFGLSRPTTMQHLWLHLIGASAPLAQPEFEYPLGTILEHGTLAQRILGALGPRFDRARLRDVYAELVGCLADNRSFRP